MRRTAASSGARQRVVGEAAGDRLAVLVVDDVLEQRLADALHDAAMALALDQQRIDDRAEVVDHGVLHHLDTAGVGIDLDLGDMAPLGKADGAASWTWLTSSVAGTPSGSFMPPRSLLGQLHDADAAVGADDGEAAEPELDVGGRGLQRHAGDLLALVDHLVGGLDDRGTDWP